MSENGKKQPSPPTYQAPAATDPPGVVLYPAPVGRGPPSPTAPPVYQFNAAGNQAQEIRATMPSSSSLLISQQVSVPLPQYGNRSNIARWLFFAGFCFPPLWVIGGLYGLFNWRRRPDERRFHIANMTAVVITTSVVLTFLLFKESWGSYSQSQTNGVMYVGTAPLNVTYPSFSIQDIEELRSACTLPGNFSILLNPSVGGQAALLLPLTQADSTTGSSNSSPGNVIGFIDADGTLWEACSMTAGATQSINAFSPCVAPPTIIQALAGAAAPPVSLSATYRTVGTAPFEGGAGQVAVFDFAPASWSWNTWFEYDQRADVTLVTVQWPQPMSYSAMVTPGGVVGNATSFTFGCSELDSFYGLCYPVTNAQSFVTVAGTNVNNIGDFLDQQDGKSITLTNLPSLSCSAEWLGLAVYQLLVSQDYVYSD